MAESNPCSFKEATGRHAWSRAGLDIVRGQLRRVRTCTSCGATRTLPPR